MSPKNSLLHVGLTALGLFGATAARAAAADPPAPPGPASAQAPPAGPAVLLKTNGQVLRGVITEQDGKYVVRQPAGEIRVPAAETERTFESLAAAYRYKLTLVPEADPDEHMKLARWCLSQNMAAEAKAQLQAVVALSPTSREAKAMLSSMEATATRLAARALAHSQPRVDPALVKTGGVVERAEGAGPASGAPGEIDAAVLKMAGRELGVRGVPVIFDLPPSVAAKRADTFARVVHSVLQTSCAKCHNETYGGAFQLIEVKSRKDLTGSVLRANLDATLRLIDPDQPSRSELLSAALLPHGRGPNKRPIFRGSNDQRFQIMSAWVNSLRPAGGRPGPGGGPARLGDPSAPHDSAATPAAFASDRGAVPGSSVSAASLENPVKPYPVAGRTEANPPVRYEPSLKGFVPEANPPSADEFPVPFSVGGAKPPPPGGAAPVPGRPAAGASRPPLPGGLPPDDPAAPSSGVGKPKKPVKLDPAALEKALMQINGARK